MLRSEISRCDLDSLRRCFMAQLRPQCDGNVASLRRHLVICTGKTVVDGEWLKRPDLHRAISSRGGRPVVGTRNADVTLLVLGNLPQSVTDPVNHRSQNLLYVEEQRSHDNHVCIVDDSGISALLRGDEAPCLRSRNVGSGYIELSLPKPKDPPLPRLVPLNLVRAPQHNSTGLELDLSGLDAGTAAHQDALALLAAALTPTVARAIHTPKVDAAWISETGPATLVIAEVKSLTGAHQEQQVRLGIGQVLDYAVTLRAGPPEGVNTIVPVLVLEKQPYDPDRWAAVASAAGIVLTWAPDFTGLPR